MPDFETPVSRRRALVTVAGLWPAVPWAAARTAAADASAPSIELLSPAPLDLDPSGYLVSEKFDGVRAVWDGHSLRFRSGRPMAAPAWFTEGWPGAALGKMCATLTAGRPSGPPPPCSLPLSAVRPSRGTSFTLPPAGWLVAAYMRYVKSSGVGTSPISALPKRCSTLSGKAQELPNA